MNHVEVAKERRHDVTAFRAKYGPSIELLVGEWSRHTARLRKSAKDIDWAKRQIQRRTDDYNAELNMTARLAEDIEKAMGALRK